MDRVVKNEWVAESGAVCGMSSVVAKVHQNYATLYHKPKSDFLGVFGVVIVFAALLFFAINNLFKIM